MYLWIDTQALVVMFVVMAVLVALRIVPLVRREDVEPTEKKDQL
ncbi:hypothetical protein UFOVP1196_33 [uncultured Caudovirales phage]|uniref:Uncharacterized protein n=1 Tax=uncultured Caudovirales phage TaxID=2100421 RepID=A0A6J5R654_9CAUD|nr:hypothetical protein UFOVP1196_33 [uncultured Caudovirales phage]